MLHCWCTFIEDEKRVAALSIQIKKTFFFFYPHTLPIRLKRPVYRGFSGEGKCEGKFLPSHPHNPSETPCLSGIQGCEGKGEGR